MDRNYKLGDEVVWRGGWGAEAPKPAVIDHIELCEEEGEKYGESVDEVAPELKDRCVFGLTNGHWAYGYQIHH